MRSLPRLGLGWALLGALAACGSEETEAGCALDADCATGQICHAAACILPARLDCVEGDGMAPAIAIPERVSFGVVSVQPVTRPIEVQNEGSCTLRLYSAALSGSGFRCPECATQLPASVYPGRSVELEVVLDPGAGSASGTLTLQTNDPTATSTSVRLDGLDAGQPDPEVTPLSVDFGFVPEGEVSSKVVQVLNATEGETALQIDAMRIEPEGGPFSVSTQQTLPISLVPARRNPSARFVMSVRYAPTIRADQSATLVIVPASGSMVRVPLSASAQPPVLGLGQSSVDFGDVRLGASKSVQVAVQNSGMSPLVVQASLLSGLNPDLSLTDNLSDPIAPGGLRTFTLTLAPTAPGQVSDNLRLQTNDPVAVERLVPITGNIPVESVEVVTVEMTFEAGSSSALDLDLRDVDLILESPTGQVCREETPTAAWGAAGTCRWSSVGTAQNPERVLLTDATADGRYPVQVSYVEDCATLPTALTATLLGIGIDELSDALAEDDVMIPMSALEAAIQQACVDRRSSPTTLVVKANGVEIGRRQVEPTERGDQFTALTLVKGVGGFSVE